MVKEFQVHRWHAKYAIKQYWHNYCNLTTSQHQSTHENNPQQYCVQYVACHYVTIDIV